MATGNIPFHELVADRFSRRTLIAGSSSLAAISALAGCAGPSVPAEQAVLPRTAFTPITPNSEDRVVVPTGYRSYVVARWGEAIDGSDDHLDAAAVAAGALLEPGAAERQARQFGYNCDGMGVLMRGADRLILCVNHETPSPGLMFPGWQEAARERAITDYVAANPQAVDVMQAAVGLSVIELAYNDGWQPVPSSSLNRRYTADSPAVFTGAAARHAWLGGSADAPAAGRGTLNNCSATMTPWGTYLTAEENVDSFFGNGAAAVMSEPERVVHRRFGLRDGASVFGWEHADPRFDLAASPTELFKFGWMVEIDPLDPAEPMRKRTSLGRMKHESGVAAIAGDGRAVVYMGDDQAFEYFYKFVTRHPVQPGGGAANRDLLDEGTLYVARLEADGSGQWLPLTWSETGLLSPANGFDSQADVVIDCRRAADLIGATPMDRPEDCAIDPVSGRIYLSCTDNRRRGRPASTDGRFPAAPPTDAANPRPDNRQGHIVEFIEADNDHLAAQFQWALLVVAGDPRNGNLLTSVGSPMGSDEVYFGGIGDPGELSGFACPDNLNFDSSGTLWIVTDGTQPDDNNNGCFACPTAGPLRGAVRQFMSGPRGAEICGCEFTADERFMFLAVQHPGGGGSLSMPISNWPDGGANAPRPSVVVVEPLLPDVRIGEV